jgi:hypothetical protein
LTTVSIEIPVANRSAPSPEGQILPGSSANEEISLFLEADFLISFELPYGTKR